MMNSNHFLTAALGVLASLTAHVEGQAGYHYFIIGSGGALAIERVDPLLSPGVASNHVHSITGGNGFKATMNFADTQSSTCTTMPVKIDKSNYWMPALYFQHNGQYTRVPEAYNRKIYYKSGGHDGSFDNRTAFPDGFRMITGSAKQRVYDDTLMGTGGNQLEWMCHGPDIRSSGFPTGFQNCNGGGLAAAMRFPSCWNGQDFNAQAPLAHMAFPTNADGMAGCPAPHNVARFPEIFIEYWLDVSQFDAIQKDYSDPNNPPWVLADGDPTGYSFHMDFFNGWETGALQKVIESCTSNFGDSTPCFDANQLNDGAAQDACRLQSIVTPKENVGVAGTAARGEQGGSVGSALPGCNPIQRTQPAVIHAPGTCGAANKVEGGSPVAAGGAVGTHNTASAASPSIPVANKANAIAPPVSTSTAPSMPVSNTNEKAIVPAAAIATSASPMEMPAPSSSSTVASGSGNMPITGNSGGSPNSVTVKNDKGSSETWIYQGCYTDLIPNRNTRSLASWGRGDSSRSCANNCYSAGYTIAGTEYGGQCFCGNTMTSTTKKDDSDCNTACTGASSEVCGGASRLSIYAKGGTALNKRKSHMRRHAARHEMS